MSSNIVLKKATRELNPAKWKGHSRETFAKLSHSSVNKFVDDVRGR